MVPSSPRPPGFHPARFRGRSRGGSLGMECESRVNDSELGAPAGLWHNYFSVSEVALRPQKRQGLPPRLPTQFSHVLPAWVTLNVARAISRGLGFSICRMGAVGVPPPVVRITQAPGGVRLLCCVLLWPGAEGWVWGGDWDVWGGGRGDGEEVRNRFKLLRNCSLD